MKKNIYTFLISLIMIASASISPKAAETATANHSFHTERHSIEEPVVHTGDLYSPAESIEEQLMALPEEKRAIAIEKLQDADDNSQIMPFADTTWNYVPRFIMYKQETSYYCVPACCKAAMQCLTGSSATQSEIANALGTTSREIIPKGTIFLNARTYLNSHQSKNLYISKPASTDLSTMKNNFYTSIHTYDAPPLISTAFKKDEGWTYSTDGHTMCISGYRNDLAYFMVGDPYIKWVNPNASMVYDKPASVIHKAISQRGNGYIY